MNTKSWFKGKFRLGNRQSQTPVHASEPDWPPVFTIFECIPGKFSVEVYEHDLQTQEADIPCWTYLTKGLERHHQCEVVFTLVRQPHEILPPDEPLQVFQEIERQAEIGNLVDAGGITQFGEFSFFGMHLAYIPAQELTNISIPPSAICAILVTVEELAAVQAFGITRLMSLLGKAARYFPCPPWSDPTRQGLSFAQIRDQTILNRVRHLDVPGCRVYRENEQVVLLLPKGSGGLFTEQLAELVGDQPFAILTDLDSNADGCFVWEPGQSEWQAIGPEGSSGSRVCGCFVMFAWGQDENGTRGIEDGFGATLTSPSWQTLRTAISNEERICIPSTGEGMALVIDWGSSERVDLIVRRLFEG